MFGGNLEMPKPVKRSRTNPMPYDIQLPCIQPGYFGHVGRQPNTDYHVRLLHWRQKQKDFHDRLLADQAKRLLAEKITGKYDKHAEKLLFKRQIDERFQEKVRAYEATIEQRREKLRELLCREEQEEIQETIDLAQKGVATKLENMRARAVFLKEQREEARLKLVNEKRLQQYTDSCLELRPVLAQHNLIDCKLTNLEQMRENEMKKEVEREIENMWYNMMVQEQNAKMERELQDLLAQTQTRDNLLEIWSKQIKGKELLKEESDRIAEEDRLEMKKLHEQIRREEIEALDSKRRKRDQIAKDLREQIVVQEKLMGERRREEEELDSAFNQLALLELEREQKKIQNTTAQAKRETAIYRAHLKELEEERKKEERALNDLLQEHKRAIEEKQTEAYCKLKRARDELQKSVLEGRAQQLEHKRQEAENQLKLTEAENELIRMACETNERLQAEHDRMVAEHIREYREDLKKQIEENNHKRRLEREQLERELAEGLAEEERTRQFVDDIINGRLQDATFKHPFRQVFERETCKCPRQ